VVGAEHARVRVLNDHAPHGPAAAATAGLARGWATVTVLPADAAAPPRLAARLAEGVFAAGLTDNAPYHLPAMPAGGFPAVETADPALADDDGAARALDAASAELAAAAAAEPGVTLSSAELYLTRARTTLRNSRGLAADAAGTQVALDLVLIAREGERAAEVHAELARRRLADLELAATVRAYAARARDTLRAATPPTYRGPVVVTGPALEELLAPLLFHASAQARYLEVSRFRIGEPITAAPPRGDRLTLGSDATRPFGVRSAPFDPEGIPAAAVTLVEDGALRAYWAERRYAEYLGIPATGAFANLVVGLGTHALAELHGAAAGRPIYEVVDFSWLNPDTVSGDFAAEIRLGYRHDGDGGMAPIKGGSLSGNLFAALEDVRLACEPLDTGSYSGPAAMRFGELTIAGE
jgi:predicted Zn-dependent protease